MYEDRLGHEKPETIEILKLVRPVTPTLGLHVALLWILLVPGLVLPRHELAGQDTVTLASGQQILGRVKDDSQDPVECLLPSGRVLLPRSDIRDMDRSRPFKRYEDYGRALLSKKDFQQAQTVFLEGLQRFAADRAKAAALADGLLQAGQGLMNLGQFEFGRQALQSLVDQAPSHTEGHRELRNAERLCRKTQQEMAGLRGAIQEAPDNDYARFQLGLRYEALGSPDKAREEYLNILQRYPQVDVSKMEGRLDLLRAFIQNHMVVEEAPPPEDLSPALRRAIPGPWKKSRTPRLTIHHHNPDLAAEIARIAEPAIERLERELEIPADRQPYALFVYRDNAAFQAGTGHSIATGYCSKPMVVHLCQTAPRLLQSVLPHELAHATLYRIYPNLPSWIDEGLAVRQEWGRELYYMNVKRWLARQDTFPLRELLQTKVTSLETARREVFYGQAFTLVDFLCQEHGGHEKFRQFIEQVASGKPVPAGLESVYGFQSIEALERIWKAHMEPGVP